MPETAKSKSDSFESIRDEQPEISPSPAGREKAEKTSNLDDSLEAVRSSGISEPMLTESQVDELDNPSPS